MADDAAYIHSELEKLADSGYDVLVNAHSYGGIPTSEALRGLSKAEREKAGKAGGVVRISYTAALTPPVGKGLNDVMAAASDGQEATKEEKADDGKASDKPMISVNVGGSLSILSWRKWRDSN
ncbi:MAG: hypothetical protein INR71_09735 [Terriglobus roseus]|nr:hypothetical protein [Terriglobus roseus]